MIQNHPINNSPRPYLTSKLVFSISLLVIFITIISIWLLGLGQHRTLFKNSILSLSLLSISFFLFISLCLYKGLKLKDDLGKITDKLTIDKFPELTTGADLPDVIPDAGEGIAGIVLIILAWLLFSGLLLIFIWFFGVVFWSSIFFFAAMLYWIFFRAMRLVFKNSIQCKGNLIKSFGFGFRYTLLYVSWIYGLLMILHFL